MAANPLLKGQDPLASLKPLIAPPPVEAWPLAPGWWLLAGMALMALACLVVWGWRRWQRHRNTRYQREALEQLAKVPTGDPRAEVSAIAAVLRRSAITAFGRESGGAASWTALAQRHAAGHGMLDSRSLALLDEAQYRADPPDQAAVAQLRQQLVAWIQTLPPRVRH